MKIKLDFFRNNSFDEEEISLIARKCFRKNILSKIKDDLSSNPFSLIVDNSTVCGENYCVLEAKYLLKKNNETITTNKILSVHKLEESSDAETMHKIIKQKLLDQENISKNLVGIVHDNASSLTGKYNGLVVKMQENNNKLFSLRDPCHCFHLVLKNSLTVLPPHIMKFILKIHQHFKSPQRKALLRKIQRENNYKELLLKSYIKTRWLSLGDSLKRLIEIWGSLIHYMEFLKNKNKRKEQQEKEEEEKDEIILEDSSDDEEEDQFKKLDPTNFLELLNDQSFYMHIVFISFIINQINEFNTRFQSQTLEINQVDNKITECYNLLLSYIIQPEKLDFKTEKFIKINWMNIKKQKEMVLQYRRFLLII